MVSDDLCESAINSVTALSPAGRQTSVLAYVHLRNIHASTGAGRTARQVVEHLARREDVLVRILAEDADKKRVIPLVGEPWNGYLYETFGADTSRQQARWFLTESPPAESYWPQAEIVYCAGESYVPTKTAKLVVTAHDAGYFEKEAHIRDAAYWRTRLKWELLFRKLSKHVDMFHTVSHFSAERLAHYFPSIKSRIRCIHNGVAPHFLGAVTKEGRGYLRDAGLDGRPYVLVPGGLHFRKNAELILAAVPRLLLDFPELTIAVVNHTNPVYAEKAAALGPRMRLLGFVSDEALHALYASATVVWFPSRYEGFGLPVIEAMACGTSVVASNSSSIPEIAGQAALLADPSDPKAHIAAISSLLTDPRARDQFAKAGRERAAKLTWAAAANKLKREFDNLL